MASSSAFQAGMRTSNSRWNLGTGALPVKSKGH